MNKRTERDKLGNEKNRRTKESSGGHSVGANSARATFALHFVSVLFVAALRPPPSPLRPPPSTLRPPPSLQLTAARAMENSVAYSFAQHVLECSNRPFHSTKRAHCDAFLQRATRDLQPGSVRPVTCDLRLAIYWRCMQLAKATWIL